MEPIAFKRYLEQTGIKFINQVSKEFFDKFKLFLLDNYSSATTINTYLRSTRVLVYYAMQKDYIENFKINLVKQDKKVKEVYSSEDIEKLIKKPNLKSSSFGEHWNWVLVQYFLDTGNRLNTVINIKVKDINLQDGMVLLSTVKNRTQMYIPLSKPLIKVLGVYIKEWGLKDDDYLFPNDQREQLTKDSIQKAIARYNKSREVNITSIHAFRHTFAKNYIVSGGNALKLQRLLGHFSLEVTKMYVTLYANDLAENFDKHSILESHYPKGKIRRAR